MVAQLPLPGPNEGECEGRQEKCSLMDGGCPLFGTLLKPSKSDGKRRIRGCGDKVATGKRSRDKGDRRERGVAKKLGATGMNTRHEELRGGPILYENKAGAKASPIKTAWVNCRQQSDAARSIGDNRPFIASFSPDGDRHDFFVIRDDELEAVVFALAEAWGYGGDAA